jgi:hypothetical protein
MLAYARNTPAFARTDIYMLFAFQIGVFMRLTVLGISRAFKPEIEERIFPCDLQNYLLFVFHPSLAKRQRHTRVKIIASGEFLRRYSDYFFE